MSLILFIWLLVYLAVYLYLFIPHGVLRAAAPVGAHSDREPSNSSTRGLSRWSFSSSSNQPTSRPSRPSRSSCYSKGRNRFRPPHFALHTPSSVVSQTCHSDCVVIYLSMGAFPTLRRSFGFVHRALGPVNSRAKDASSFTLQSVTLLLVYRNVLLKYPPLAR
jgi:hypothetical protein